MPAIRRRSAARGDASCRRQHQFVDSRSRHHRTEARMTYRSPLILSLLLAAGAVSGCNDSNDDSAQLPTLDGSAPLIIGHRGLPGLYPEETQPSYENAADAGADSLETDLHLSKDCVLVARHNPWLSDNTTIAQVAAATPEV